MFEIDLNFWLVVLIIYLLIINLVAFFIYALDKAKSVSQSRRVSEKILWLLVLIGGSVGALVAMHLFRHKTKKLSFQAVLALVILLQVWLIFWLWN